MKILLVVTSQEQLGATGKKTGVWLEELAAPYYIFRDAGAEVVMISPKGGQLPVDPNSETPAFTTDATRRFKADAQAMAALANTGKLSGVSMKDFDAVYYPGGHGVVWDLAEDQASIAILNEAAAAGIPIGTVCHGPGALRHAKSADGKPLVYGRSVTGFSNTEEAAVGLTEVVPFLLEDMLKQNGGRYTKADDWQSHVVVDGKLVTGQNPASSEAVARALLRLV
jgi:putative intracellular protease/amidase